MDMREVRRQRGLKSESGHLKRLIEERDFEIDVSFLIPYQISERRSCDLAGIGLSSLHYQAKPDRSSGVMMIRMRRAIIKFKLPADSNFIVGLNERTNNKLSISIGDHH